MKKLASSARLRRVRKTRSKIALQGRPRLSVHRTPRHIYVQLFSKDGSQVLASASSVEKELRIEKVSKVDMAKKVGKLVAQRAKAANAPLEVAFDRSGFKFHGRVKALADSAKENGFIF